MAGLLLVGASGLAREVLTIVRHDSHYRTVRVVDDNPYLWGEQVGGAPVIGGIGEVKRRDGDAVVVCVGHGTARRRLVERLTGLGVTEARYATVVHPGVEVPEGCIVGAGSIVLAQVVLTADVCVGRHVVAMPHVTLTHDDVVEDFATLCAGVTLGGDVRVGPEAYLGMSSSVRERLTVGAGATLGMGAVLLQDLPPGETWFGVPATRHRRT